MNNSPRVSIIICNFNYAKYVHNSISSALNQDYSSFEVIVVDDGSTDESRNIIELFGDKVISIYKENEGQPSAYNAGFVASIGEVIIFLDSDDYLLPFAVSRIVKKFTARVVKVHYKLELVNAMSQPSGRKIPSKLARGELRNLIQEKGILYASAPGSGNAYLRSCLIQLMPLPISKLEKHGADFYLVYGSSLIGEIAAIEDVLGCYRINSNKESSTSLVFGNASQLTNPAEVRRIKIDSFRNWIYLRLKNQCFTIPKDLSSFSTLKTEFVLQLFKSGNYFMQFKNGILVLPNMLNVILRDPANSFFRKFGLIIWAISIVILPRIIGLKLARFVCNPSSR